MSGDDRLDLSPLDAAADPARWRGVMDSTLARVDAVLRHRRQDPLTLIAGWTKPLLVASAVAIAALVPLEIALELREREAERVQRLVELSVVADQRATPPTGVEFRRALLEDGQP